MPFQSEKQRRLMWAKHPAIARRWADKYGDTVKKKPKPAKKKPNPLVDSLNGRHDGFFEGPLGMRKYDRDTTHRPKIKPKPKYSKLGTYKHEPLGKTSKKHKYKA